MRQTNSKKIPRPKFLASLLLPLLHILFNFSIPLWSLLKTISTPSALLTITRNTWDAICLPIPARISKQVSGKRPRHVAIVLSADQARRGEQHLAKLLTWLAMARVENVAIYDEGGSLVGCGLSRFQSLSNSSSLPPFTCQILGPNDGQEALVRAARHIVRGALLRQGALQRHGALRRQGAESRACSNGSSTKGKRDVNPEPKENPKVNRKSQPGAKRDIVSGSSKGIERWKIGGKSAGLATDSRRGEGWEEGGDGARTGGVEGWGMLSEDDVEQSLRETGRCAWQAGGLVGWAQWGWGVTETQS